MGAANRQRRRADGARGAVEFGVLTRQDGKVTFRELTADEITKLLKDADLDKKEDEGARA